MLESERACSNGLEIKRSRLHLGESQRVVVSPPVLPHNTSGKHRVWAAKVFAVEVGVVTVAVPPRTFVPHCT